ILPGPPEIVEQLPFRCCVNSVVRSDSRKLGSGYVHHGSPTSDTPRFSPRLHSPSPPASPPHQRHSHSASRRSRRLLHHPADRRQRLYASQGCATRVTLFAVKFAD